MNALGYRSSVLQTSFCDSALHLSAKFWGDSFLPCLAVCNRIKWYWSVWVSWNRCLNTSLNIRQVTHCECSSKQPLLNCLAASFKRRIAKWSRSESSHNPTLAAPSIRDMNCKGIPDTDSDHFGTNEIKERSLWSDVPLQKHVPLRFVILLLFLRVPFAISLRPY